MIYLATSSCQCTNCSTHICPISLEFKKHYVSEKSTVTICKLFSFWPISCKFDTVEFHTRLQFKNTLFWDLNLTDLHDLLIQFVLGHLNVRRTQRLVVCPVSSEVASSSSSSLAAELPLLETSQTASLQPYK